MDFFSPLTIQRRHSHSSHGAGRTAGREGLPERRPGLRLSLAAGAVPAQRVEVGEQWEVDHGERNIPGKKIKKSVSLTRGTADKQVMRDVNQFERSNSSRHRCRTPRDQW